MLASSRGLYSGARHAGGYGIRPYGPRENPAANRKPNPGAYPV